MMVSYIDKLRTTTEGAKALRQEEFILEVTELICKLMKQQGVSRTELANRMGKSKGRISQLLDGEANLTLRTLSDIFDALGHKVVVDFARTSNGKAIEALPYREQVSNPWKTSSNWPKDRMPLFQSETFRHALAG
jgi:transcriptional regulator with XRE-family HTH domain